MPKSNFKLDKETLIKHRFWFLLGLLLPLVLITLILVWTSVARATADAKKNVADVEKSLDGIKNPVGPSWVPELGPRERKGQRKKKEIWEHAWKSQEELFVFPGKIAELKRLPFGTRIGYDTRDKFENNADILNEQLDAISKIVHPVDKDGHGAVQYLGGDWKTALGTEPTWQDRPRSDEIWCAMEDLWLKAGMLDVVKDCNDSVAEFRNKDAEEMGRLGAALKAKRAEVEKINTQAKAPDADAKLGVDQKQKLLDKLPGLEKDIKALEAQLAPYQKRHTLKPGEVDRQVFSNRTWRLELVLANNPKDGALALTGELTNESSRRQLLGLYFDVTLRDNSTSVRILADGDPLGPRGVVPIKALSPVRSGDAISGVRQIFDWRTVPVKRIDKVLLSIRSSSRTNGSKLSEFNFPKEDGASPAQMPNIAAPATGTDSGGMQKAMQEQMAKRLNMGQGFGSSLGGNGAGGKGGSEGGLLIARYTQVDEAVRRLPVAMKVVMDQAYLQDLLTAAANSKLRIQITQVEWKHFPRTESIEPPRQDDDTSGPSRSNGLKTGGGKLPPMGMSGIGNPGNPGNPGLQASASAAASGSDEMSANLIEVAVYGIASIYTRYTPNTDK